MADVASSFKSWSATAASNAPTDATAIGSNLADNFQMVQAVMRAALGSRDTIASASTCDLGSKDAGFLNITGTTTITSFGTVSDGIFKVVWFSAALTLTYNGTSLILPTGASITTALGDAALMLSLGSGNWRCLGYLRADGSALSNSLVLPDGSVATPSIRWTNDPSSGPYRSANDTISWAINGVEIFRFLATGILAVDTAAKFSVLVSTNTAEIRSTGGDPQLFIQNNGSGGAPGNPLIEMSLPNASGSANVIEFSNSGGLAWRVDADGATFADGAYTGSGADYAEGFQYVGPRPNPGDTVVLTGDRVRLAQPGEEADVLGVVSERPCVLGDARAIEAGGVPVGVIGKLRVNDGQPTNPIWKPLGPNLWFVR